MKKIWSKLVQNVKDVWTSGEEESFIENQRRHVFHYFMGLMYASFVLYMFVVTPSTWAYPALNAVFFLIELGMTIAYFGKRISLTRSFTSMLYLIQFEICLENVLCSFHMVEYPRLLIMANMLLSFMFILIAVCGYLGRTSLGLAAVTFVGFAISAYITQGSFLLQYIFLIIVLLLLTSLLGHLVYSNALRLQSEYKMLRKEEREVLKVLQISKEELMALVELSNKENSEEETRQLIETLGPKAKGNLFAAFQAHAQAERTQQENIKEVFPELSPSEQAICRLILQDKTVGEICEILFKSPGNITSQRARIRAKLGLKREENLKEALQQRILQGETMKGGPACPPSPF